MRWPLLTRRVHYWVGLAIALPVLVVLTSGLLLQLKKQWAWIQPPEQRGSGVAPRLGLPALLAVSRTVPAAGVRTWADITRIDNAAFNASPTLESIMISWKLPTEKRDTRWLGLLLAGLSVLPMRGVAQERITTPREQFGFNICDDYLLVTLSQFTEYWRKLDAESPRIKVVSLGKTEEGRDQPMAIITAPANFAKLDRIRDISARLARARGLMDETARELAQEGKAVVWIDAGLHSTEVLGPQVLVEHVYRMAARNDAETLRILDDVIQLVVLANPDGMELVNTAYMKLPEADRRAGKAAMIPRLYSKYNGHDNNRDFYMNAMAESKNINRVLNREWYPQIVVDHHQEGPGIIDIPPTTGFYNPNIDPLALASYRTLGNAMLTRFVAENKPGVSQRTRMSGSTWSSGAMSNTPLYHNQIGILVETKGNPAPFRILDDQPEELVPAVHNVFPVMPQVLHFRTGLEYALTANMGILAYASRMREDLLYNIYVMGRNSIQRGSEDSWTIGYRSADRVREELDKSRGVPYDQLFQAMMRRPEERDARGYVLPSDQPDFLTATRFVNALLDAGVEVGYATEAFSIGGRRYPAGSYVIRAAQAFRPHLRDMFEPQYLPRQSSIVYLEPAGYTLALQMGVKFDWIRDGFDCPCADITDVLAKPPMKVALPNASGYLLPRTINDSYRAANRLLRQRQTVLATAKLFYVPATATSTKVLRAFVEERGLPVQAADRRPAQASVVKPYRVGLLDQFGGTMASGWIRWLLEQFEFPFEVVYAPMLDEENLSRFDALVLPVGHDGVPIPRFLANADSAKVMDQWMEQRLARDLQEGNIPAEYHRVYGFVSQTKTMARLQEFVRRGGRLVAIGNSRSLAEDEIPISVAEHFGLPVTDHLAEVRAAAKRPAEAEVQIWTSLLEVTVDTTAQAARGMDSTAVVVVSREPPSPVMRLPADAPARGLRPVARYTSADALRSGWISGGEYLVGGVAALQAEYGKGTLYLYGPEITYRGQSHGTLKFLFNGILGQ